MRVGGFQPFTLSDCPGHCAAIVFTAGCNLRCPWCHNPSLVRDETERPGSGPYADGEGLLAWLETRRGRLTGLVLTGGEPTVQPDLVTWLERVKALGYHVKLDTNGTRPGVLRELFHRGLVDHVAMDVKAPPERYGEVAGRSVSPAAIRSSVRTIIDSGIPHEFRTTVVRPLLDEPDIEAIAALIAGGDRWLLQPYVPGPALDSTAALRFETMPDRALRSICSALRARGHRCEIRSSAAATASPASSVSRMTS